MAATLKFTDRAIQSIQNPANQRAEYADTRVTGLRLRVTPNGVKTFSLLRRLKGGRLERVTIGRFPEVKCEEVIRRANELIGVIATGANPAEVRRAMKAEMTFADLWEEWLERHAKRNKRWWKNDVQRYTDYLAKPIGHRKLSSITRADIANVHGALTRAGHPTNANQVKALASSIFSKAIEWGYMERNPAHGISNNPERARARFLHGDELARFFASLAKESNETFRDFLLMSLLTGARRANVREMRWAELDLDAGEWRIPRTKNNDDQNVPLVPEAVEILRARKAVAADRAKWVFPAQRADSKLGHVSGERKAWLRILDRDEADQIRSRIIEAGYDPEDTSEETVAHAAERLRKLAERLNVNIEGTRIEDIRQHDLRRTLGSWQARKGASLVIIGKSLGHKSQQATAIYARLDTDPVRASMETATSAMLEAGRQKTGADVLPYKKRA